MPVEYCTFCSSTIDNHKHWCIYSSEHGAIVERIKEQRILADAISYVVQREIEDNTYTDKELYVKIKFSDGNNYTIKFKIEKND